MNLFPTDPPPASDPTRHRPLPDLQAALRQLPALPRDRGHLSLIVRRFPDHSRETPAHAHLTPAAGLPGDNWQRTAAHDPDAQLTLMCTPIAQLIAHGQPLTLFGDNLFVDLDLSAANLPTGSRLALGAAILQVTPKPHNGCRKFSARFGPAALHFVNAHANLRLNLRGIYCKVLHPGPIHLHDPLQILTRGPAPTT